MTSSDLKAANRVRMLLAKKDGIESRIRVEMTRRMPCSLTLSKLKKLKLVLKDKIATLSGAHGQSSVAQR